MATSFQPPSRTVLSQWITETTGTSCSAQCEKQCSNGVIYCQLLEAFKPGSIPMQKLDIHAVTESKSLQNYKLLSTGLAKAGFEQEIDPILLAKGQPQATLDLLHKLFRAFSDTAAPKGLAPLDANAIEAGSSRSTKRRAAAAAAPKSAKKPSTSPTQEAPAAEPAAAASSSAPGPAAPTKTVEEVLRQEVEEWKQEAAAARQELSGVEQERNFYVSKLECIEHACNNTGADSLKQEVLRLVYAEEEEVEKAFATID